MYINGKPLEEILGKVDGCKFQDDEFRLDNYLFEKDLDRLVRQHAAPTDNDRERNSVKKGCEATAMLALNPSRDLDFPGQAVYSTVGDNMGEPLEEHGGRRRACGEHDTSSDSDDVYDWPLVASCPWPTADGEAPKRPNRVRRSKYMDQMDAEYATSTLHGRQRVEAKKDLIITLSGGTGECMWAAQTGSLDIMSRSCPSADGYIHGYNGTKEFIRVPAVLLDYMQRPPARNFDMWKNHDVARAMFLAWALRKHVNFKRKTISYPFPPFYTWLEDPCSDYAGNFQEFYRRLSAENRHFLAGFCTESTTLLKANWPLAMAIAQLIYDQGSVTYAECWALKLHYSQK